MSSMSNDNSPTAAVNLYAYFGYRDAPGALEWLGQALGFETTMQFPDDQGGIIHAELRLGDAAIVVFSDRDGYDRPTPKGDSVGHGMYLGVADDAAVDAAFARAVGAGAEPVWEPVSTEWGNYRCRVRDLEGFEWTFATHQPGQPQGDWDGDGSDG